MISNRVIILSFYTTGGSFGLWTGISLFTVVEFIYFIGKKIRFVLCKTRRSSSVGGINSNMKQTNAKDRQLPIVHEQPTTYSNKAASADNYMIYSNEC